MMVYMLFDSLFHLVGIAGLLALVLVFGWGFLVCMDYTFLSNPEDDGVYYPQNEE